MEIKLTEQEVILIKFLSEKVLKEEWSKTTMKIAKGIIKKLK